MLDNVRNSIPPGEKGSKGNPLTVEELEDTISKANGGVEVKVKGYREFSPSDMAIMNNDKFKELTDGVPKEPINSGLRINLKEQLHQSLKDIERKPKKVFHDRKRDLFLALDQDDKLWILEGESWFEITEPSFPDLPNKEVI